jgi:hypothetical protein
MSIVCSAKSFPGSESGDRRRRCSGGLYQAHGSSQNTPSGRITQAWPEFVNDQYPPSHTHGYQGHIPNKKSVIARACYKLFGHVTECQPEFDRPFMDFRLRNDNPPKRGLRCNINHAFNQECSCLQCRHVAKYVHLPAVNPKKLRPQTALR